MDARIGAGEEDVEEAPRGLREAPQLLQTRREQMQDRGSARQALGERCQQREVLGAREDPKASSLRGVHDLLEIGGELGRALNLVEDRALRKLGQEAARVLGRELAHVRGLERGIRVLREGHPSQRRLARLPRPRDGDGGELAGQRPHAGGQGARDHGSRS
jgi:hypothetical protein